MRSIPIAGVSEACQINDLDHHAVVVVRARFVSEACQINDLDHAVFLCYNNR